MVFGHGSTDQRYWAGSTGIITAAVLVIFSPGATAQEEFFIPRSLHQNDNHQYVNFSVLNNTQLVEHANALRSQDPNTAQRELNYQWVESHLNDETAHGSKAYKVF